MKYHVANISKEMIEEMNKEITHINNVILISINDIGSSPKIENTNFLKIFILSILKILKMNMFILFIVIYF